MRQLISALIIALAAIVFALQNASPVNVKFFVWEVTDASLALVLITTLIIGMVSGMFFLIPGMMKRNKSIGELKKQISKLEKSKPEEPVIKSF
ncbi:MAG TPA: LapA family protein [Bacteroidia bacterium]|nr:LapA family protein [Bacteroidia bacterium]